MNDPAPPSVLITGAAGFIGSHAVEAFLDSGWRVTGMIHRRSSARLDALARRGALELVRGDAASAADVAGMLRQMASARSCRPVIVHCAGRASDVGRESAFRVANYDSVRVLGNALLQGLAGRLVFVSTTDVYGIRDHHQAEEDSTPLKACPDNPYPRYKIRAEHWIRKNLPPQQWSMVRPAAVWGVGDRTLTPRIVAFLRLSPAVVHFGPWRGANRWPLAHVHNVAMALRIAATDPAATGCAANVVDSEVTSIDRFYRLLGAIYFPGKRFRTLRLPFAAVQPWCACVSALSTLLNLDRPFADPSLYALHSVSRNLDFSNARWLGWMARHGLLPVTREAGFEALRREASADRG